MPRVGASPNEIEQRKALFIEAYIANGGNGSDAYVAAGFTAANANVAAVCAHRLLSDAKVAAEIERRRKEALDRAKLTSEEVMRSMAQALRFDPRKLYRADGSLKPVLELDEDTAMALSGLEVVEMAGGMKIDSAEGVSHVPMYTKKVKWLDKNAAREQAHKHFGHYEADNAQQPPVSLLAPGVRTITFEPYRGRARQRPRG